MVKDAANENETALRLRRALTHGSMLIGRKGIALALGISQRELRRILKGHRCG